VGLSRRSSRLLQISAVIAVIVLTAMTFYRIKSTLTYEESGTVVFVTKQTPAKVDASFSLTQSLTTTGEVIIQALMSQNSRALARQAGGTAAFNAGIMNFGNEDLPSYAYPIATLIVQGSTLESVQTTFKVVTLMLKNILSEKQAQADVRKVQRITASIIDAAGPFAERPSRIRAYAGLGLLSIIGSGMLLVFTRRLFSSGSSV
jgi:hypothetical protein